MGDLAREEEVERCEHILVVGELHEILVDDFRPRLGGDVGPQVDRQVAVSVDVGALPGHAVAVGEPGPAARNHPELGIDGEGLVNEIVLGEIALAEDVVALGGILEIAVDARQKHLDGSTDNLQMAQLLGGDVHQKIVLVGIGIVAGERLHEILHGRFQLAVAAAELLEQQAREPGVGPRNPGLELEFLGMVEHTLVF